MSALARFHGASEAPANLEQPQIRWSGRRHALHWYEDANSGQPVIELADVWSGETQMATVPAPGWIGRENEAVLRSAELARALADHGLVEPRFLAMRIGSLAAVLVRLTPLGLAALAAGTEAV